MKLGDPFSVIVAVVRERNTTRGRSSQVDRDLTEIKVARLRISILPTVQVGHHAYDQEKNEQKDAAPLASLVACESAGKDHRRSSQAT